MVLSCYDYIIFKMSQQNNDFDEIKFEYSLMFQGSIPAMQPTVKDLETAMWSH